jgi:hypothetical protein
VALFAYAGLGAQQHTPPEVWHLEPDRPDETLVCGNSCQPACFDPSDKELAQFAARLVARLLHVVVILDACHSGTGRHDLAAGGTRIKWWVTHMVRAPSPVVWRRSMSSGSNHWMSERIGFDGLCKRAKRNGKFHDNYPHVVKVLRQIQECEKARRGLVDAHLQYVATSTKRVKLKFRAVPRGAAPASPCCVSRIWPLGAFLVPGYVVTKMC